MKNRTVTFALGLTLTLLGGVTAAQSVVQPSLVRSLYRVALAGNPGAPVLPKPFTIPAQPIVAASSNGYLPSSWTVTPRGEFTLSVPLAVPPGRLGMAPALSLDYASSIGNGLAGVGWALSGFSTITRGGRVFARHGVTDGVDFGVHDRFYLDGQELVGIDATPYGGNNAEYRTEPDAFVRVRSTSAQPLDAKGPESFTVELGDGRVRTYTAVEAQQITFNANNQGFSAATVRVAWHLASEQDAYGNTAAYEYDELAGPGGASASDYWYEDRPSKIEYTANLTHGAPTHGPDDAAQRTVFFSYEARPDVHGGWLAGVQVRHASRLKAVAMYAPNPTAKSLVWLYQLSYATSGSGRSLLTSVQRCEAVGGCVWAKEFGYSPAGGVAFQGQPLVLAPITASDYDLSLASAPEGEVPALQMLDLNGDGASDLLFGPGAKELWEHKYYGDPFFKSLPDGKFLGGGHSLWLSERDANGAIEPLHQGLSLPRDEEPLASAHYGHVRLDAATGVDLDADGHDEVVAMVDNTGAHEINLDPTLPPLYDCSYVNLRWTGAGFEHIDATPCTYLGNTNGSYKYYLPGEFPTFADFDGDGLVDRATPYNASGWVTSNDPVVLQFAFAPAWQVALNFPGKPGVFAPAEPYAGFQASPGVVTDLDGDGHPELTSEALKSSLTLDADGHFGALAHDSVHMPLDAQAKAKKGYREFGDYNGDGTEDELRLVESDPQHPEVLTGQIFWNTGRGFYPDEHLLPVPVDVHPDVAQSLPTRFTDPGIHVTDIDNNGCMDLVVFNNDHKDQNQQPYPQILILLSNCDGTFSDVHLAGEAGTRDDVKYALDNALRSITIDPVALENDQTRLGLEAFGQVIPGAQVLLKVVPWEDYITVGSDLVTPGLAAGWNLATLADVNGDGAIDIVRHVGGNSPQGGIEVLQQAPEIGDELVTVKDEATAWPAVSVEYASEWSDRPEVNDSYQCIYPQRCIRNGLRVVRAVTSRAGLTDVSPGDDPLQMGQRREYSYRDPRADMRGSGFLGFSEMRTWDGTPERPVETITTFDLDAPDASGTFYPGAGVPATVTVAQPILSPGQSLPTAATARITTTTLSYYVPALNGGKTHAVLPQETFTRTWEEPVAIDAWGHGPDHVHVSGYAVPAAPPIEVDRQLTYDDFGNVINTLVQTTNGRMTDIETPRVNDTANWRIGQVSEETVMTLESAKDAEPYAQTTAYTYTDLGDIESVDIEPGDPELESTTTLTYDDYGLVTTLTHHAAGEAGRVQRIDYTTAWPGAPDEHLYASALWAEHDTAVCGFDCRPAIWRAVHPAYGVTVATMDRNGVQDVRTHDGHGRTVGVASDGTLPIAVTYSGRPDAFGGMNGLQTLATSGLQEVLEMSDARGAPLRIDTTGFDGQWLGTFATYDLLGRRNAVSRPSTGVPTAWTTFAYDSLGRTVKTVAPDGSTSSVAYALFEVEGKDAAGHASYQEYDVDGRLVVSGNMVPPAPGCSGICLAQNVKTHFEYTATKSGAVDRVIDDQGHVTETTYDRLGRPVRQDDPSRGVTLATYNGFGETKSTQHVASGETKTTTYDDLGRMLTATSVDGLTSYTWDVAANGIGRLARAMSPDQVKTEYRYDGLGRTAGIDQSLAQASAASLDFGYDPSTGRLATIDYPEATGQANRLRIAYAYNGYGYLKTVSDATPNQPPKPLQEILARNADLALIDATRGGGAIDDHRDYDPLMGRPWTISAKHAGVNRLNVEYAYDADGLVKERERIDDAVQIDEVFDHDALHRLTHTARQGQPLHGGVPFASTIDETYDTVGNRIDTQRNGQLAEHRQYGNNGLEPYAVTAREVSDPAAPNLPPTTVKYDYDALGRLKADPERAFTWTAFDLPREITQNGAVSSYLYDAGGTRVRKKTSDETIEYAAGLYEKHTTTNGTRHVYHVVGADQSLADIVYTEGATPTTPGTVAVTYPLTDLLGSTYGVADANGEVGERDYYDAWGLRTDADGTPVANLSLFQSLATGGFTGHEHDDGSALINMHGRIYDPILGRFLSPDPLVGNPVFGQRWNAYSYVLNSPLNLTDPSGFDECPAGFFCTTGPGNEITNTIQTAYGSAGAGAGAGSAIGAGVGSAAATAIVGAFGMMKDLKSMAREQHALDFSITLPNGKQVRTPDGTPVPRRWYDNEGHLRDAWGSRIRGKNLGPIPGNGGMKPDPDWSGNYKSDPLIRFYISFSRRLFCGAECSTANAPTSAGAATTPQLGNARIARNAVSQALAARSLVKFLGKVGVVIDEGFDGLVDQLTPDGMGIAPKTAISTLATKERYARELRHWIREVGYWKYRMLHLNVMATSAHAAYLEAVQRNAPVNELVSLANAANDFDARYLAAKAGWYETDDYFERSRDRFEKYIRFGQWEQSGMDVPDPETANYNLDPYSY